MAQILAGCTTKKQPALFTVRDHNQTGLHFTNTLKATPEFNMFKYMYFYNGAGVGAGDFNGDGKTDLFFSANQGQNKLYLNKGALKFEDVTQAAGIPQDGGWSTGVSVVDINADGLLDIYVCRVGNFETLKGKNQLLINKGLRNGIPHFQDEAAAYGLDFSGFSTQAAFFDYDLDGDLDCYLLNHSVHQNGTFAERKVFMGTTHPLTGDRIYENRSPSPALPGGEGEGKTLRNKSSQSLNSGGSNSLPTGEGRGGAAFVDVTPSTGINSSAIGYGLGIAIGDINLDGWPDIYVGNDFHENDYLYINQRNGTFRDELAERTTETSQFSMGVDVADINNDALPDIISMDMLPSDPYVLKRSLGEDEYNIFNMKVGYGYHPQYARNTLQLQQPNGLFSEVGRRAGIHATDWSWAPLWMDFDNDGRKDLFISNGIPKRLNDIDYVNYISNDQVQGRINAALVSEQEMAVVDKFPQIKLPNKFFRNKGDVLFEDLATGIEGDLPTFSNGSVYADLDGDGDQDIVVNNIDDAVLVYENHSNDGGAKTYLSLQLKGPGQNTNAVGSKALVFAGKEVRTYEYYPVKGFQSSMQVSLHLGLAGTKADSLVLVWPDGSYQKMDTALRGTQKLTYQTGLPRFNIAAFNQAHRAGGIAVADQTEAVGLQFTHVENPFVEFDREPLIPHMVSREGPALAIADINGDGRDDVFFGSAKGEKAAVLVQDAGGRFRALPQPALALDSMYEEVDAAWADVNRDGAPDLLVASGGNEYYGQDPRLQPRLYLNDGKGRLTFKADAFPNIYLTASCILPQDINGDGLLDLFVGGRAVPWAYGQTPRSYLLQGDGRGGFTDVTARFGADLGEAGLVTGGTWTDMDRDGDADLVLSLEWDAVTIFENRKGSFVRHRMGDALGWWQFAKPLDVDGDGDLDLVAGNLGENNRLKPGTSQPVNLYFGDFDGNGQKEQVLTYWLAGREIPFANKAELEKQVPILKKQFLYAGDFAKATLTNIIPQAKLDAAQKRSANYFSNAVLINEGGWKFAVKALPWPAQLTTYRDAVVVDVNSDGRPDLLPAANFFDNNIQMGRYAADHGSVWVNSGNGNFAVEPWQGTSLKGQVRKIKPVKVGGKTLYLLALNGGAAKLVELGGKQ
ncbi:VCBS repeat-containing protein [Cnuella takakiae]|uniref:VCBS repeat-containing protein n=1 Tax=Cnuella takakiae TaxID=1302690 RepID=UPI001FE2EC35|nr:VCBS repeat-containing protein [Cnuella takakiae]